MRPGGAGLAGSGAASRGCWLQTGAGEESLQGARAGQGLELLLRENDADVRRSPGGVLAAQLQGGLTGLRLTTTVVVGRWHGEVAARGQPAEQTLHGAFGELQGLGDRGSRLPLPR
jgi:hypothetical protein